MKTNLAARGLCSSILGRVRMHSCLPGAHFKHSTVTCPEAFLRGLGDKLNIHLCLWWTKLWRLRHRIVKTRGIFPLASPCSALWVLVGTRDMITGHHKIISITHLFFNWHKCSLDWEKGKSPLWGSPAYTGVKICVWTAAVQPKSPWSWWEMIYALKYSLLFLEMLLGFRIQRPSNYS